MPTTDVNINHRLSATGFDGRASHILKPGGTNNTTEMHKDTQGLEICLHPSGTAPRAVSTQLPNALPYSSDIKTQYDNLTSKQQVRYLGKGTESPSIGIDDTREHLSVNDLLLNKLVLPNTVLPTLQDKSIDVNGNQRTLYSSFETMELKNGTDANIDRGDDVGSGITLRMFQDCTLNAEEELEELLFDDIYEVKTVATRHLYGIVAAGPALAPDYQAASGNHAQTGLSYIETQNVGNTGYPISTGDYLQGTTPTFGNQSSSNTYVQILPKPMHEYLRNTIPGSPGYLITSFDASETAAATAAATAYNATLLGFDAPMTASTSDNLDSCAVKFRHTEYPKSGGTNTGGGSTSVKPVTISFTVGGVTNTAYDSDYITLLRNEFKVSVVKPKGLDLQLGASQYTASDTVTTNVLTSPAPGALEFRPRAEFDANLWLTYGVLRETARTFNVTANDWYDPTASPSQALATVPVTDKLYVRTFTKVSRQSDLEQDVLVNSVPVYPDFYEVTVGAITVSVPHPNAGEEIPGGFGGLFDTGSWDLWEPSSVGGQELFQSVVAQGLVDLSKRKTGAFVLCAFHSYSNDYKALNSLFSTNSGITGTVYDPNGTPQNFDDARRHLLTAQSGYASSDFISNYVFTSSNMDLTTAAVAMKNLWGVGVYAPYYIRMNIRQNMILSSYSPQYFSNYLTDINPYQGSTYSEHMLGGLPATGAFADPSLDLTVGDSPSLTSPWTTYLPGTDTSGILLLPAASQGFSNYGGVNFGISGNILPETTGISFRGNMAEVTSSNISDIHVSAANVDSYATETQQWLQALTVVGTTINNLSNPAGYPSTGSTKIAEGSASVPADITSVAVHSNLPSKNFLGSLNTWSTLQQVTNATPNITDSTPSYLYTNAISGEEELAWYDYMWASGSAMTQDYIESKRLHDEQIEFFEAQTGDAANRGIVRAVNNLALLANDTNNDWISIPTNPGATEVPGERWFDWKKMAKDLLDPSQATRLDARLAEGVYSDVLPGTDSMMAVFEAVVRILNEDYVDGANGYNGIDTGPFYDRNTAIAESSAFNGDPILTADEQIELLRATELMFNLRAYSEVSDAFDNEGMTTTTGGTGVSAMLHWLKEESKYTDVSNVPTSSLLRSSSLDGMLELACAYSLIAGIARSSDDGSAMTRVMNKVLDSATLFAGTYTQVAHAEINYGSQPTVVTVSVGGEGLPAGPYTRLGSDLTVAVNTHPYDMGSYAVTTNRSSTVTDNYRCPSDATLVDPRDGVTKGIGSMVIPHLGNTNPAQPYSTVEHVPHSGLTFSAAQWADPAYVTRHVVNGVTQSYPAVTYPADLPTGFSVVGDAGVGFNMNFMSLGADPTNLTNIAKNVGQGLIGNPDSMLIYPTYRALAFPWYVTLPYGFNTLQSTTSTTVVTPVELGIHPGIEMATAVPTPNARGEVSYIGTSPSVQGLKNWVVDRAEPHMFPTGAAEQVDYTYPAGKSYGVYSPMNLKFREQGTDPNGVPYDRTASMTVHLPEYGLHDPALLTATPTSVDLNWVDPDDRSATGTWSANGDYLFDGKATMDLFNRDRNAGMFIDTEPTSLTMFHNSGSEPPARTDHADDSLIVRKFKTERDALAAQVATVDTFVLAKAPADGSTGGFDNFPTDTILSAHETLQPALSNSSALAGSYHKYELSVHPLEDVDIRYYAYDVSGETKYMYPVYLSQGSAEAADLLLGGPGEAVAYGVDGSAPVLLADQNAIDNYNGTVLYQSDTNDTDVREVLNRYKLYSTHSLFRNGQNSGLLDTFFKEYPEVAAGTSHDPDTPVDAAVSTLTWNQLATLMTDSTMGGDVNDPDPGRRLRYVIPTQSGQGFPLDIDSGTDEQVKEALTPRGARLASKFKPGWTWGGSTAGWDALEWYNRGASRVASSVTSYGQVPQDNLYAIDYTYAAEFVPFVGIKTLRVTT